MLLKFATRDTGVFDERSPHPETLKLREQSGAREAFLIPRHTTTVGTEG